MSKNMCVIGLGTVGKATMKTFDITKYFSRSSHNITLQEAAKCDFIFICLPTPIDKNGRYYTDDITDIIARLSIYPDLRNATIVIRSTVFPGYNLSVQSSFGIKNVVSNPEFLSEDTWEKDAIQPQLVIIGGDIPEYREKLKGLYMGRFKYNEPVVTNSITAELIKISLNGFFTTKVVFANSIYNYAQILGANYETVRMVLENHPWGSKNHFQIFHKGGRGAGGKCLQKDMVALAHESKDTLLTNIAFLNNSLLLQSQKT